MSAFLRGIAKADPVTGALHVYSDLFRRKVDLERMVCRRPPTRQESDAWIDKGIDRVH